MQRCLELASLGISRVAPNPMVGAVLVYENRIIGEGYHEKYGEAHAEVNCIQSVKPEDQHLIDKSTLYVSLEPCAHFGKTPPCTDLIIKNKIPRVIVGCPDPFAAVNGKGIEKLKAAGIDVDSGIMEYECRDLNKRFIKFHTEKRPFVILKWAQSSNGRISGSDKNRVRISNEYSNRVVHKWRSEEMAIMVGKNTAFFDDPELTTRLWPGENPVRLVVDLHLELPQSLRLFNGAVPTIIFNYHKHDLQEKITYAQLTGTAYYQLGSDANIIHQVMNGLYQLQIQSLIVEGGAFLLQSFIDEGIWDEARIITNEELIIENGLPAPVLNNESLINSEKILADSIKIYYNKSSTSSLFSESYASENP